MNLVSQDRHQHFCASANADGRFVANATQPTLKINERIKGKLSTPIKRHKFLIDGFRGLATMSWISRQSHHDRMDFEVRPPSMGLSRHRYLRNNYSKIPTIDFK